MKLVVIFLFVSLTLSNFSRAQNNRTSFGNFSTFSGTLANGEISITPHVIFPVHFSNVLSIDPEDFSEKIFPNPIGHSSHIYLKLPVSLHGSAINVKIYELSGSVISEYSTKNYDKFIAIPTEKIQNFGLSEGSIIFINIIGTNFLINEKLIY